MAEADDQTPGEQAEDQEPPDLVYITFQAEITPRTTEALISAMAECANSGTEEVRLLLSTPGGHVTSGIAAYNVLRGMPFQLVTHNVGTVASIGNVMFLAGERRIAAPDSTFWFHGVTYTTSEGEVFDEKGLRTRIGSVLEDQGRIAAILEERTTLTKEHLKPMFLEALTKEPTAALDSGIVHEIAPVDIPPDAVVIPLVF